jgi:hypothetical protein
MKKIFLSLAVLLLFVSVSTAANNGKVNAKIGYDYEGNTNLDDVINKEKESRKAVILFL